MSRQTRGNKFFELSNHLGNVLATITDRKLIQSSSSQTTGVNNGGCVPGTALDELVVNARGTASTFTARMAVHLEAGFETNATDEVLVYTDAQQSSCVTEPPGNVNTGTAWYAADVLSAVNYAPFGMALVDRSYSSEKYRYGFNGKEKDKDMNSLTAYDYGFRIYNPGIGRFLSVEPLVQSYPMLTPYQFASNTPIAAIDLDGLESKLVNVATRELTSSPKLEPTSFEKIADNGGLTRQIVNWLIPRLHFKDGSNMAFSQLSDEERSTIVQETVSAYLSLNSVETMSRTMSGEVTTQIKSADFNYELLFDSKTSPKIASVKMAFEQAYDLYDTYASGGLDGYSKVAKKVNTGLTAASLLAMLLMEIMSLLLLLLQAL